MQASTIYSFATPPGRSAVAILRLSGPAALPALHSLGLKTDLAARHATRIKLESKSELIDDALCLYFPKPHSYTGEDVIEIHCHGGAAVRSALLNALKSFPDLRPAEPGEFTRQAYLNGKLDLVEAESIRDLIDADTETQRKQALRGLAGEQSNQFEMLRKDILQIMALLEAYIDFPDEDIPPHILSELFAKIEKLGSEINAIIKDSNRGIKVREGYKIAVLGPPNVGKSSFINYMAKSEVAIVSDIPGTTRDSLEIAIDLNGYPILFYDTAGLRETNDPIEKEGIRRSFLRAQDADLVLYLINADSVDFDLKNQPLFDNNNNSLVVANKADKLHRIENVSIPHISIITGQGMNELVTLISSRLGLKTNISPLITSHRQKQLLELALLELKKFSQTDPIEIMAEHLREASNAIGNITGKISSDEVLGVIFSHFCIGK